MLPGTTIDAQAKRVLGWTESEQIPGIGDDSPEP